MRAVLTAKDLSGIDPFYNGRPVVAMDRVRYVGEPVAAVAAEDEHTAEAALALIDVDYEESAVGPGHGRGPGSGCAFDP